jgi:predicted AAA+ superfamily ATPase
MPDPAPDSGPLLARLAAALERLAPPPQAKPDFSLAEGFVWRPARGEFRPVAEINRVDLALLEGIDLQRDLLLANTSRFAKGLPANNALLWGARGMGKSSLVKAVHAACAGEGLKLVEIHREDVASLPALLHALAAAPFQFVVFCDDLTFDGPETSYKALKTALEGGIEGRPRNVVFYATSNRRHLTPREMTENESASAIHPGEAVEEKVSLSDRFGLWIGFYHCSQDDYLAMVFGYAKRYGLDAPPPEIRAQALEWAMTRGARSGRVAWQFIQDLAGRMGKRLD